MTKSYALGIDIGGTKVAGGIVSESGQILESTTQATPKTGLPYTLLEVVTALSQNLLVVAAAKDLPIRAIGIGTAGQVDFGRGRITYAVETLPNWAGAEVGQILAERLKLPVVVDNDVNALAIGEARFGGGRGSTSGLYVAVGTGIGGAIILDGQLWRGAHWSAGELGHMLVDWPGQRRCNCGQWGHLEAYAAGPALAQRYNELAKLPPGDDLRPVAQLATAGDHLAQQTIQEGARILGLALIGLLNTFDPEVLVIGGGVTELGGLWWATLDQTLRTSPMPAPRLVRLKKAELGVAAVLIGAAWLALEQQP